MGWIISTGGAKTREDYIQLLKEIEAYRSLDGEDFDFGAGLIKNEMSYGSEDAYYKMDINELRDIIEYWDYCFTDKKRKHRQRPNKHARKRKHIQKMKSLMDGDGRWYFYPVYHNGRYNKRFYRGKRSAYLKKQSSKKIRNYKGDFEKKGNVHKRVFDFWWELD